jgi:biopolymer transport protein ExbB
MSAFSELSQFMQLGGNILWVILMVAVALWSLIIERLMFFKASYPELRINYLNQWQQRDDKNSAHALFIRQALISEALIEMSRGVSAIKILIALCPLLGLLGTVTGMIHVFDVMAIIGTGNARAMAAGVSKATIPTMAGMVIAIAGLYFSKLIEERVNDESHHLADLLKYH